MKLIFHGRSSWPLTTRLQYCFLRNTYFLGTQYGIVIAYEPID